MSNTKLQQVFRRIVLNSLAKNPKNKGLYKQAVLTAFWQSFKANRLLKRILDLLNRKSIMDQEKFTAEMSELTKKLGKNLEDIKALYSDRPHVVDPVLSDFHLKLFSEGGITKERIENLLKNSLYLKPFQMLVKHYPVETALYSVGVGVPIGLAAGAGHSLISYGLNRARGEKGLPDPPEGHLEKGLMNFRTVLGDLNKKIEDYREGLKNMEGDAVKFLEKVKQDAVPFHKYFNANFKDKIENSLTKDQLAKGVQNFMANMREDIKGTLSPQALNQNPEIRSGFRSGIVSSFTDPMFRAIGADPDKVSPSLKLLTLLGLAGGTLGLGSYLGSKLTRMF